MVNLATTDILKNKAIVDSISQSLKDLKDGRIYSFQEVVGKKQKRMHIN